MLAVLAALIVVLLLAILGSDLASPGKWSKNFRVHLGLDLTSGTTVALRAVKPGGRHADVDRHAAGHPDHGKPGERRRDSPRPRS